MELKSFLVLPANVDRSGGTELFRGRTIAGYGFGSLKEARVHENGALRLSLDEVMGLFKEGAIRKLIYYEYEYSDDPQIGFSDSNVERVKFEKFFRSVEENGTKALVDLLKVVFLMENDRIVFYEKPVFGFSLFSTEETRRETAKLFLEALDKVWRGRT